MADYDSGAREAWQKFIKAIKSRLEAIHLISDHLLIRIGAATIGAFAGIKIHTWTDMEEFHTGF
jgi:UDP-N-acetylglucosamine transferase subunit ALG13